MEVYSWENHLWVIYTMAMLNNQMVTEIPWNHVWYHTHLCVWNQIQACQNQNCMHICAWIRDWESVQSFAHTHLAKTYGTHGQYGDDSRLCMFCHPASLLPQFINISGCRHLVFLCRMAIWFRPPSRPQRHRTSRRVPVARTAPTQGSKIDTCSVGTHWLQPGGGGKIHHDIPWIRIWVRPCIQNQSESVFDIGMGQKNWIMDVRMSLLVLRFYVQFLRHTSHFSCVTRFWAISARAKGIQGVDICWLVDGLRQFAVLEGVLIDAAGNRLSSPIKLRERTRYTWYIHKPVYIFLLI